MGVDFTGQSIYFKLHFDDYHISQKEYGGCFVFVIAGKVRPSTNPDTLDCRVTAFLAMTASWQSLRSDGVSN
jgi:hypothetical protein